MTDNRVRGIDVLRGLGIFVLLTLHSAFYYFGHLYELDFDNPPLIITIIGFLLMFAGLFGILSGMSHVWIMEKDFALGKPIALIRKKKMAAGLFVLVVAYVYFIFVGPALVMFEEETMNNSIFVELLRNGQLVWTNAARVLYIDSLVMIGINILLLGLLYPWLMKKKWNTLPILLTSTALFMAISLIRIPLYAIYIDAIEQGNWFVTLVLNWFVNKNNPILPYFGFALLGASVAKAYLTKNTKWIVPVGGLVFLVSMIAYIFLPDTMLERLIDLKWFSIMWAQAGIYLLLIALFVKLFATRKPKHVFRFLERFGYAGLTPFFWESIVAAIAYNLLELVAGPLQLGIGGSVLFGCVLAILWGFFLMLAEKRGYPFFVEQLYAKTLNKIDVSTKGIRLAEKSE